MLENVSQKRGSRLSDVTSAHGELPYMNEKSALVMQQIIADSNASDILELGFYHGKSSAYIAAILEDQGRGHLTTIDRAGAKDRSPNITQVLDSLSLSHRVTPIFSGGSFLWDLALLLREGRKFDLAYIDGGHTWQTTGFAFCIVDQLLRPGGVAVFDDLDWTIDSSPSRSAKDKSPPEQRAAKQVRMVIDLLVKPRGYTVTEINRWGVARKPA
jgi:predicted O-methyltransferase YrrM